MRERGDVLGMEKRVDGRQFVVDGRRRTSCWAGDDHAWASRHPRSNRVKKAAPMNLDLKTVNAEAEDHIRQLDAKQQVESHATLCPERSSLEA
jgi:hypothetical protein